MNKALRVIHTELDKIVEDLARNKDRTDMPNIEDMHRLLYDQNVQLARSYMKLPEDEARRTMERIGLVWSLCRDYIQRVGFDEFKKEALK